MKKKLMSGVLAAGILVSSLAFLGGNAFADETNAAQTQEITKHSEKAQNNKCKKLTPEQCQKLKEHMKEHRMMKQCRKQKQCKGKDGQRGRRHLDKKGHRGDHKNSKDQHAESVKNQETS